MMKRKMLQTAALCCAVLLALCLAACGGSDAGGSASYDAPQAPAENYDMAASEETGMAYGSSANGGSTALAPQDGRKIILTANLTVEALDFDATCASMLARLEKAGGYISSSDIYTPSYEGARRSAHYQLRVPVAQYDRFMTDVGEIGNVVSKNESGEDVTAEYVDVDAHLKSLRLQEERLYEMMEQAGELETLLAIQNQLTEVQYQIESYMSRQRTLDDLIACCTVNVDIEEVRRITEKPETFADRVAGSFQRGWSKFGSGVQDFIVWFVGALPALLLLAALAALLVFFLRKMHKRSAAALAKRGPYRPAEYTAPAAQEKKTDAPAQETQEPKYK